MMSDAELSVSSVSNDLHWHWRSGNGSSHCRSDGVTLEVLAW